MTTTHATRMYANTWLLKFFYCLVLLIGCNERLLKNNRKRQKLRETIYLKHSRKVNVRCFVQSSIASSWPQDCIL